MGTGGPEPGRKGEGSLREPGEEGIKFALFSQYFATGIEKRKEGSGSKMFGKKKVQTPPPPNPVPHKIRTYQQSGRLNR